MSNLAERLDSYPEAWKPSVGDKLIGELVDLTTRDSEYGDPYPILTIDAGEGSTLDEKPISGEYAFRRPDRFHVKLTGGRGLEAWYDGKGVTVAIPQEKVFAQAPMPETIDRTLDALAERYDLPLPLGDLFNSAPQNALLSETTTGGYAGTESVGDTPCYHLSFRDIGVNWEIWLPVEGPPLPKRLKVEQARRKGQPVTDVTFTAWNVAPQVTDATFAASVPSDFEGIAILQKAAAVKKAAPDAAPPVR